VPQLPKPELPSQPDVRKFPMLDIPKLPEFAKPNQVPEIPKVLSKVPETSK